ncbi:MAG: SPOR domain-containing protein [Woeseiaceae bacterium]|nr:SPOR domain-containing protein [Woeseiaceae bacterium]
MAAKRKRRKSRKRAQRREDYPGWAYGLFGLAVGLSVAVAVWLSDHRPTPASTVAARAPASMDSALDDNGELRTAAVEPEEKRFEFYDMLPKFEVVVPEEDPEVARDTEPKAVVDPGVYVLQAGSFTTYADADRRRAELALQGIQSSIQRVTIDDKTYHRVRIGPTRDLDELNMLRSRLRAAKIDVLRIRLGD